MISALILFGGFIFLLALNAPVAIAIGLPAVALILFDGLGIASISSTLYASIAKYPLLAVPMFVFAGTVFERCGAVSRMMVLASLASRGRPALLGVMIVVLTMLLGGVSGSANAVAAAVMLMVLPTMTAAGYPKPLTASIVGASSTTDVLIPPSLALILYSVFVPDVTVPALFAAGMVPGILLGLAIIIPTYAMGRRATKGVMPIPDISWTKAFAEASWGLMAPVVILGGMRIGWFTPTEAAVVAAAYAAFLGVFIFRAMRLADLYRAAVDAAEMTAIIMMIVGMASLFAWAGATSGIFDPIGRTLLSLGEEHLVLAAVLLVLLLAGLVLDGVSMILIFTPILIPVVRQMGWDPVWFGITLTLCNAVGQMSPPVAVAMMITSRIAGVRMASTLPYCKWLLLAMVVATLLMVWQPELALWLPRYLGY